jgi:hypothetical protein
VGSGGDLNPLLLVADFADGRNSYHGNRSAVQRADVNDNDNRGVSVIKADPRNPIRSDR